MFKEKFRYLYKGSPDHFQVQQGHIRRPGLVLFGNGDVPGYLRVTGGKMGGRIPEHHIAWAWWPCGPKYPQSAWNPSKIKGFLYQPKQEGSSPTITKIIFSCKEKHHSLNIWSQVYPAELIQFTSQLPKSLFRRSVMKMSSIVYVCIVYICGWLPPPAFTKNIQWTITKMNFNDECTTSMPYTQNRLERKYFLCFLSFKRRERENL